MKLMKTTLIAASLVLTPIAMAPVSYAADKVEMEPAQIVESADISVGLNGLVCDFCSIALNKTFKKNKNVAATYVDLDAKKLSVVLKDGKTLSDEEVTKMVKKAGYSVTEITRKDG